MKQDDEGAVFTIYGGRCPMLLFILIQHVLKIAQQHLKDIARILYLCDSVNDVNLCLQFFEFKYSRTIYNEYA